MIQLVAELKLHWSGTRRTRTHLPNKYSQTVRGSKHTCWLLIALLICIFSHSGSLSLSSCASLPFPTFLWYSSSLAFSFTVKQILSSSSSSSSSLKSLGPFDDFFSKFLIGMKSSFPPFSLAASLFFLAA